MAHEIGHAIGFKHEQSRPDRDSHVRINEENVISDYISNFDKGSDSYIDDHGIAYDYTSDMHYGSKVSGDNYLQNILFVRSLCSCAYYCILCVSYSGENKMAVELYAVECK